MTLRQTHTYVTLDIPAACHAYVKKRLEDAGYSHAIEGNTLDMHGLALIVGTDILPSERTADEMREMAREARENPKSFPQHPVEMLPGHQLVKERQALTNIPEAERAPYAKGRLADIENELQRRSVQGAPEVTPKGLTAYRARFPDPAMATLWEHLPDYVQSSWAAVEDACRAMQPVADTNCDHGIPLENECATCAQGNDNA